MIVVVGLSHRSAPIAVREKLVLDEAGRGAFLRELVQGPEVAEALLVSTCNRVELVAAGRAPSSAELEQASGRCLLALSAKAPEITPYLYAHTGGAAVRHLFRVAASLDSMVLGEPQILGQVKEAYEHARGAGTVGPILNRTLPRAIRAAKRVRTETSIGSGQVSVPSVAADLAREIFADLSGRPALLVGAGEMAEAVARLLRAQGASIVVVGRTEERAQALARSVGGVARRWGELRACLVEADVVITSTSAPNYVIDWELVREARRSRRGRNQFLIDLAVPRDVDPRVGEIDGEFLYNIDDLSKVVADSLSSRQREAEAGERIVALAAQGYDRWADSEQATPTIVALRARMLAAFEAELSRSLRGKLKHLGPEERSALEKMVEAAVNRLLHQPTMRLRQAAADRVADALGFDQLAASIRELFALDGSENDELEPASAEGAGPSTSPPPALLRSRSD